MGGGLGATPLYVMKTQELKYFILWYLFGLVFALILSLYFNFPFLPKKKYEQGFWNYLSRFLIFFIPYFFFLIVRLILFIIYKLRIIKHINKPSVIASILFFTLFIGYFANIYANEKIFFSLIDHPLVYQPISKMDTDYRRVIWQRNTAKGGFYFPPDRFISETLIFNSDTSAFLINKSIEKNNFFIWKYVFNIYDYIDTTSAILRNDSLISDFRYGGYDIKKLTFKDDTLSFRPNIKILM